jgi:hydroxymethylpyrimidine pyrophosphatase-like HAD family hydrolase
MEKEDVLGVCEILTSLKVNFLIHDLQEDISYTKSYVSKKPSHIFVSELTHKTANVIIKKIDSIPTIALHKVPSWTKGKIGLLISHASSTKLHAVIKVAEMLNIKTNEIIGVGDGYNDFPLLMASGLKVAMGNAVPELKEIADYIAPGVDDDGVADVIAKFILPQ